MTVNEALSIIKAIRSDLNTQDSEGDDKLKKKTSFSKQESSFPEFKTALEKMSDLSKLPPIITFCHELDEIIGGGVQLGKLTEFCGLPGVGKTQMGIQLALNCYIPSIFGGCDGKAIYIDTEGSFVPDRALEMTRELVNYLNLKNVELNQELNETAQNYLPLSEQYIFENFFYYRIHNYIEQLSIIGQLSDIIHSINSDTSNVRCIVLDSIAFHFRSTDQFGQNYEGNNIKTRLLSKMASELTRIASKFNIAIVIINQVIQDRNIGILPALGDFWAHQPSTTILLEVDEEGKRIAKILKSSENPMASAIYQITNQGIR